MANENQERDFSQRQMYPATCSDCGAQTQVPFQPSQDRPVYCKDCYAKRKAERGPRN